MVFSIQAHIYMRAHVVLPVLSRSVMAERCSGCEDTMCIFMPRRRCFIKLASRSS